MAQTLPNGVVIPEQTEPISAAGVQEMRTLGASVDTALAAKAATAYVDNNIELAIENHRVVKHLYALPGDTDLDGMTDRSDQGYYIISLSNSEGFGLPRSAGVLQVLITSSGANAVQLWEPISGPPLRRTYSSGSWSAWESTGGGAGAGGVNYAIRHHLLREDFSGRMGTVDTGGKGAIALRFDHGLTKFSQIVRPLLQARGFKCTVAMNSRTWGEAQNSAVTPAVADSWTDVEFANHSATHEDAHTTEGLHDEIVTGLQELQSQLPNHPIDGWIVPGVGGSEYDGFGQGGTDAFANTLAGQLILGHHAWSSRANRRSVLQPLDGRLRTGYSHFTYEAQTVAATKARIDNAIAAKAGTTLMMHPDTLNTSGRMTTAQLTEVLDYIKGKVDAGELVVLTMGEMMVADSTRSPEYDSGEIDITPNLPGVTAGTVTLVRIGSEVWLNFGDVTVAEPGTYVQWNGAIPAGMRPPIPFIDLAMQGRTSVDTAGPVRVSASGQIVLYKPSGVVRGLVSWPTREAPPA